MRDSSTENTRAESEWARFMRASDHHHGQSSMMAEFIHASFRQEATATLWRRLTSRTNQGDLRPLKDDAVSFKWARLRC